MPYYGVRIYYTFDPQSTGKGFKQFHDSSTVFDSSFQTDQQDQAEVAPDTIRVAHVVPSPKQFDATVPNGYEGEDIFEEEELLAPPPRQKGTVPLVPPAATTSTSVDSGDGLGLVSKPAQVIQSMLDKKEDMEQHISDLGSKNTLISQKIIQLDRELKIAKQHEDKSEAEKKKAQQTTDCLEGYVAQLQNTLTTNQDQIDRAVQDAKQQVVLLQGQL